MKTLLLMRHAKSDWNASYGADHDRPLNQRGVRSARTVGRLLSAAGEVPDLIVTSTAVRARTTAELAAEAGDWDCEIRLDERLYGSGPDTVLGVAAETGDANRLMLVGHQPTWSSLVYAVSGDQVDMKTANVAVIELEIETWPEIVGAVGQLTTVYES